jgi:hypothetical protein
VDSFHLDGNKTFANKFVWILKKMFATYVAINYKSLGKSSTFGHSC